MNRKMQIGAGAAVGVFAFAASAGAFVVDGRYFDTTTCDNNGERIAVEELGFQPVFPLDETIFAVAIPTDLSACPADDDPMVQNFLIEMTNTSGRRWTDLFYVGDAQTQFSNVDGFATTDEAPPPGSLLTFAFRIDAKGDNRPLITETGAEDGVFAPGETWLFVVQDYVNQFNANPADFSSLDFAGGSLAPGSSASIVQFVVPTPGSVAAAAAAGLVLIRRRRAAP